MDEEEYEKWMMALEGSSGHKKVVNYVRALVDTQEFKDFVDQIRKKYKIPVDGFKDEQRTVPPTEWPYRHTETNRAFSRELSRFAQKHHLHHLDGEEVIAHYVFYNELVFYSSPNSYNLCTVSDIPLEKEEPFSKETQEDDDRLFPVAIRVSPYASQRDILDFVKRAYKHEIAPTQATYKEKNVTLGKCKRRKEDIRKRNDLIYKNRHLPRKEIMHLLTDKYGSDNTLDYAYIGKIISLEKKRRKEV